MKLGIIESGKLKGRKIILEPRDNMKPNEYLVEKSKFFNGSENFALHCLVCEKEIPVNKHECTNDRLD